MTSTGDVRPQESSSNSPEVDADFVEGTQKLNNLLGTFTKPKADEQEADAQSVDLATAKSSFVIIHYTASKMLWDWIVLSLTTYTAVVVPLVAAFRLAPRSTSWLVVDSLLDVFFLIDMGVNFHTTFIGKEGTLVTDLNRIRLKYAKSWFVIDVLSCLPYDAITISIGEVKEQGVAHLLGALKAFRLLRIIRIARDVDRYLEHAWASLLVMISLILLICHWMACGWYAVSIQGVTDYLVTYSSLEEELRLFQSQNEPAPIATNFNEFGGIGNDSLYWNEEDEYEMWDDYPQIIPITVTDYDKYNASMRLPPRSWLLNFGETLESEFQWNQTTEELTGGPRTKICYTACMYFAMTNVISAGFGNIGGETKMEKIYCIFILTIGGILYAAILGNVTNILQQFNAHNHEFLEHIKAVRDFAKIHELPSHLTESICDYMMYTRVATHGVNVDRILDYLPEHKRAEVCVHLHRAVLHSQPVFLDLNDNERSIVAKTLQRCYAAPGDIVCDRGELVDSIFFVICGSLEVTYDGALVAILSKGDCFGIDIPKSYTYTSDAQRCEVNIRALTYVDMDTMTTQDLLTTMKTFPRIDIAFRRKWRLTYNILKTFEFRLMEAVQWEREEAADPEVARKFNRLRKWRRKTQKKREERLIKGENTDETATYQQTVVNTETNVGNSIWRKIKRNCIVAAMFVRSHVARAFTRSAANNNADCEEIIQNAESIAVVEMPESEKRESPIAKKPLKKVKLPKTKQSEVQKKFRCCGRCGKPVKKNSECEKVGKDVSLVQIQTPEENMVNKTQEDSNNIQTTNQIKIPDTMLTADVYSLVDESNSRWVKTGEVSFTLESGDWLNMKFAAGIKEVLQCLADFKTEMTVELLQIETKICKNEELLSNILSVVSDDSFEL